jgi:hypothetical protein
MPEERPRTNFGGIELEFSFPLLDIEETATKIEHTLLPTTASGGEDTTVIQSLGQEAARLTLRGDCYRFEVEELDEFPGQVVSLRHPRFSGDVFVDSLSTQPEGAKDSTDQRYSFRADLIEV